MKALDEGTERIFGVPTLELIDLSLLFFFVCFCGHRCRATLVIIVSIASILLMVFVGFILSVISIVFIV